MSNPDKVLWPATTGSKAHTKLDLAKYYAAVAEWMMPHVHGRPCSIVRTPDGIDAERFFQRHTMRGGSALLGEIDIAGDPKPYLLVERQESLLALAQIAAVEIHPWNCAPGLPEVPGRLVFDLDPGPGVAFDAVVATALELKQRLEAVGLVSLCKTTGGKGLHVVTPVRTGSRDRTTWAEAKAFALQLCEQMMADDPQRYVVTMSKKLREGRIFLDYLRNERTATAVAPLSPRARAGAPVSMRLGWSQVRAGLDPSRFTLDSAPGLLRRTKPWADYSGAARSLRAAAKQLSR